MKFMPAATRFLGKVYIMLGLACSKVPMDTVIPPVEAWQSLQGTLCVAEPSNLCVTCKFWRTWDLRR